MAVRHSYPLVQDVSEFDFPKRKSQSKKRLKFIQPYFMRGI